MVQIKTPDLGSIHNIVDAVFTAIATAWKRTRAAPAMKLCQCPHLCPRRPCRSPHAYAGKPGMGFDEGLDIVFNEMNRISRCCRLRINKWLVLLKSYRNGNPRVWIPGRELPQSDGRMPDLIAVDAGSSDPGPHYLGEANRLPIAQGSSAICAI